MVNMLLLTELEVHTRTARSEVHAFCMSEEIFPVWAEISVNPSFTKLFSTHTFYQGGGGVEPTPQVSQKPFPHEGEILQVLQTPSKVSKNVNVLYTVFTWLL